MKRPRQAFGRLSLVFFLLASVLVLYGVRAEPMNWTALTSAVFFFLLYVVALSGPSHATAKLRERYRPKRNDRSAAGPQRQWSEAENAQAVAIAEYNMKVISHVPDARAYQMKPVRLNPIIPPSSDAKSWIGGTPTLPNGMDWPEAAGEPMAFLAQIYLPDLPEMIWGGLGPRAGSLAFFSVVKNGALTLDIFAIHLDEPSLRSVVSDRDATGFYFGTDGDRAYDLLADCGVSVPRRPFCWPVEVEPLDGQELPTRPSKLRDRNNPRWLWQREAKLSDPAYQPFNWASARLLVESLRRSQEQIIGWRERSREKAPKLIGRDIASRRRAVGRLEVIAEDIAMREGPFQELDWEALHKSLLAVVVESAEQKEPGSEELCLMPEQSVISERNALKTFLLPFEMIVKDAYLTEPNAVAGSIREALEAVWRFDAAHEFPTMGGVVGENFPYARYEDPVFLLDLPSGDLVGWMFGDVAHLGIFIAPDDLKAGHFDKCWAAVSN
ncbi:MAG: DUF1963 domain-containing protein [Pseudomonadota bacterium]